tara:strand:+ start:7909 stop:8589 length:681 start_codon:yes stop_codon:yes gene_type:complete
MKNPTKENQIKIYKDLYENHKGTPMAVSSESLNHKKLRFKKICGVFEDQKNISVHDVGMGIGDLGDYIKLNFETNNIEYSGSEILPEYVVEARKKHPKSKFFLRDIAECPSTESYDYVVLSGVFHQMRSTPIKDWERFAEMILKNSYAMCSKAIAFNMVSPFVDFYQQGIYYSKIEKLIHFINTELSRFFVITHNYALYEFTIYVYKEGYVQSQNNEPEFKKYFKI